MTSTDLRKPVPDPQDVAGESVLATGGTTGVGRAVVLALAVRVPRC